MRTKSQAGRRRAISRISGLSLIVAFLTGCGGSSEVKELPEASKKALIQRKVDVEQRSVKPPKTGPDSSNGQPAGR